MYSPTANSYLYKITPESEDDSTFSCLDNYKPVRLRRPHDLNKTNNSSFSSDEGNKFGINGADAHNISPIQCKSSLCQEYSFSSSSLSSISDEEKNIWNYKKLPIIREPLSFIVTKPNNGGGNNNNNNVLKTQNTLPAKKPSKPKNYHYAPRVAKTPATNRLYKIKYGVDFNANEIPIMKENVGAPPKKSMQKKH